MKQTRPDQTLKALRRSFKNLREQNLQAEKRLFQKRFEALMRGERVTYKLEA